MAINDSDALVTPKDAARLLGVSWSTLDRMVKAQKLTAVYLPSNHRRFAMREIQAALAERRRNV